MVDALRQEMLIRKDYLANEPIASIYFGGGTPSILSANELTAILDTIYGNFLVEATAEITLEANPDDLSVEKLTELKSVGINRLSIGIQTFDEATLSFMNRSHNAQQAVDCLKNCASIGFTNISTDLIFAVPPVTTSIQRFDADLKRLMDFEPAHISLYSLTVEPKTVFGHQFAKREFTPVPDEINALQYELAIDRLTSAGYEQYEVSNFGKPGFLSAHNSSYWQGKKYAGFGPGAHSYNGVSRSFNVRNNAEYIRELAKGHLPMESEMLTPLDELNEYILTRSRTKWGLDLAHIQEKWGLDFLIQHEKFIRDLIDTRKAILENGIFRLTSRGFSLADEIALHFFSVE